MRLAAMHLAELFHCLYFCNVIHFDVHSSPSVWGSSDT